MELWIPLLQSLVWPVLIIWIIIIYSPFIRKLLNAFTKSVEGGASVELPGGIKLTPRPIDQDPTYANLMKALHTALSSRLPDAVSPEAIKDVESEFAENIKESSFLTIDSRPLQGPQGETWPVYYYQYRTVSSLLDDIWATIGNLANESFGVTWALEAHGKRFSSKDIGRQWARRRGRSIDDRPLDHEDVGILPGMTLKIIRAGTP